MNAKQCDRCGGYYSDGPAYPTVKLIDGTTRQLYILGNNVYDCDLCQTCWNELAKWWEKKQCQETH